MSVYLGFEPDTTNNEYYFVSYGRGDSSRISEIIIELHRQLPIWYDRGLTIGLDWESSIIERIDLCKAIVIFFTKDLFMREDTFVRKEFRYAQEYKKPIYIIWLDDPGEINFEEISDQMQPWMKQIKNIQGLILSKNQTNEEIAQAIIKEIDRSLKQKQRELSSNKKNSVLFRVGLSFIILCIAIVGSWFGVSLFFGNSNDLQNTSLSYPLAKSKITPGTHFSFGEYEQDGDETNGEEPIEWIILSVDKKNRKFLVISEHILDCISYDSSKWKDNDLRDWTENIFYLKSFSNSEKRSIVLTTNQYYEYEFQPAENKYEASGYVISPTGRSDDHIFVLDVEEANDFFDSDQDRIGYLTSYAANKLGRNTLSESSFKWGIRNMVDYEEKIVNENGSLTEYFSYGDVDSSKIGVRPAMWLKY